MFVTHDPVGWQSPGVSRDRNSLSVVLHPAPGSAIIGTSSEQATDPSAKLYDYLQTKTTATTNSIESLAKLFASCGIQVNGVARGLPWTFQPIAVGRRRKN